DYLYIYVIKIGKGNTDIEHLREVLRNVKGIILKAFVKNPETFVIHAETDFSRLLSENGFTFLLEKKEMIKGGELK
ncbi:MAG: hypothetical protein HYW88_01805, partial [Candidatus Sungbacteria bacterium]|nr:hypothetical protein [Candidatus Sungbacteria bacterium]